MKQNIIIKGDCIEEMKKLPENSVDSIVTDPPYGLSFMGKKWDYDVPSVEVWKEAMRVLKHGGHLLSFAGSRTYHRMAVNIEDAGFEIRDMISWLYGSGFPKSLNIGKQIDKKSGAVRNRIKVPEAAKDSVDYGKYSGEIDDNNPITQKAKEWEGWGTALKPAHEPIVVARKPLSEKNNALNVLKWGTGGINIDGCRIGFQNKEDEQESKGKNQHSKYPNSVMRNSAPNGIYNKDERPATDYVAQGRFPANVILECICDKTETSEEKISGGFGAMKIGMSDTGKGITQEYDSDKSKSKQGSYMIHTNPNCPCRMLDEQSGVTKSKKQVMGSGIENVKEGSIYGKYMDIKSGRGHNDKGGASRFFYCAKASKSERNLGCEDMDAKKTEYETTTRTNKETADKFGCERKSIQQNVHPTVKPLKLMQYLVRLVTKKGGLVLDPFLGSGTTALACIKQGMNYIGIEQDEDYCKIAEARIKGMRG